MLLSSFLSQAWIDNGRKSPILLPMATKRSTPTAQICQYYQFVELVLRRVYLKYSTYQFANRCTPSSTSVEGLKLIQSSKADVSAAVAITSPG